MVGVSVALDRTLMIVTHSSWKGLAPVAWVSAMVLLVGCGPPASGRQSHRWAAVHLAGFARNAKPHVTSSASPTPVPYGAIVQPPFTVGWAGQPTGSNNGNVLDEVPNAITTNTNPLVTVYMQNISGESENVSYQLLITDGSLPFTPGDNPDAAIDPGSWPGTTWNSNIALPAGSTAITLQPGQEASASIGWPAGAESPATGSYTGVVYIYVNGAIFESSAPWFSYQPFVLK
jgi:hypothetical protein